MIDKNTNHPRGFGFITLKNEEKVSEVLCTQPHYICGKKVDCKIAIPKELLGNGKKKLKKKKKTEGKGSSSDSSSGSKNSNKSTPLYMRKMFVGGLHPSLTTKSLIGYFSKFGKIEKGIIMTDKNTGKSRGFGFIVFKEKETIDKIISNSNCHFLYGKWIECKRAQPKPQNVKMLNENSKNPNVNYYKNLNNQDNNILLKSDNINYNQIENVNSNKENTDNLNNVIINNYFANKGQELLGDKYLYDKNLFMYQNYIPRDQIKYFLNNNYNNIINEMNNSNNNSSNNDNNSYSNKDSDTNISSLSQNIYISNHNNLEFNYISNNNNNNNLNLTNSKESLNLSQEIENNLNHNKNINNNNNNIYNINLISNNNQQLKFQNYFNNNIINPLTYNYFHYKLFDSYGEEISKLEPYSKTKEKIKLFPEDMNKNFDISKQKNLLKNNIEVLSSLVYNKMKKNNDVSFGPDRNGARGEKSKSSGNSNESFRPY
jgi:RNA recognition motif-containing protein